MERRLMDETVDRATEFLDSLPGRRVIASASAEELRAALGGPLTEGPSDPAGVIAELAKNADPGLTGSAGPRWFGFVIGGSLPAAASADWLTTVWDQNAGLFVAAPAAAVVEDVVGGWLAELLGLPTDVSFGIATGATMANFTALAAARHHVLAGAGWDVESDGLGGAPQVNVILSEEHHVTVAAALRYLGFGTGKATLVPVDGHGRMRTGDLRRALLDVKGPTIVCTQAGNVNTGSFDPIAEVCDAAHEKGAWVHVDGAFGLWAAAAPSLRYLAEGIERADSWGVDGHKWLNVPYDSAFVFCAHPAAHRASMGAGASYLVRSGAEQREALEWVPEFSRRARGFTVYAALKSLGRSGLVELVERCCSHARLFAELLRARDDIEICNDVVLNQVLVRFLAPGGDHDARTRAVIARVQEDGTCWLGGSKWQGKEVMRISVSNWSTTTEDVEVSAQAIARAADATV